ncbi:hypothetical protein SEVIR_6G172250v4 [Setaria viridis]
MCPVAPHRRRARPTARSTELGDDDQRDPGRCPLIAGGDSQRGACSPAAVPCRAALAASPSRAECTPGRRRSPQGHKILRLLLARSSIGMHTCCCRAFRVPNSWRIPTLLTTPDAPARTFSPPKRGSKSKSPNASGC